MIFPITKSCYKIIKHVYATNGIKISRLLKDTSVSQRIGYKHINKLIKNGVLKEKKIGALRIIQPNLNQEAGQLIYSLIEKQKELKMVEEKPKLKESLMKFKEHANSLSIETAVIFGAFAKKQESEKIEVMIICEENDKRVPSFLQNCFNNVENAVSARILSRNGFMKFKNTKKDLFNELFKNHICVYNTHAFLRLIA